MLLKFKTLITLPKANCEEFTVVIIDNGVFINAIGDGYCDDTANNANCNYDGGDCCGIDIGAFYQLFVRLSSATSFEPISGNIVVTLDKY